MALSLTTVTGTIIDGSTAPSGASVQFTPTSDLTDLTGENYISSAPVTATPDQYTGEFTIELVSTDNPGILPVGWLYSVTVTIGTSSARFTTGLPSSPATVDITDLMPAGFTVRSGNAGVGPVGMPGITYLPATGGPVSGPVTLAGSPPLNVPGATSGQILASDGSGNFTVQPLPSPDVIAGVTVSGAAASGKAITATSPSTATWQTPLQNAGDLGGTPAAPTVTGTHLASPLPLAQGGTGSAAQNFADLSTNQTIAGIKTFTGEVIVPVPLNSTDAATKSYVDAISQGLSGKYSARAATTGSETFTIASGSVTQISGTAVDGVSPAVNDRILVKDAPAASGTGSVMSAQPGNGLYVVTGNTTNLSLSRASDMSGSNLPAGAYVFTEEGTVNASAGYVVTTPTSAGGFTYGTGNIQFTQFSSAGLVTAGTGLSKSGSTLSLITPVPVISGGTGQTTAQAAINALTGTQTAGRYLRSDGTNAALSAITAGDLPGATTGSQGAVQLAGDLAGSASAPAVAAIQGTAISAPPGGTTSFLAGNGTWVTPAAGVTLDSTATDIKPLGTQAAGSSGLAAKADHVHPHATILPSGDATGATDAAAINALVTAGVQEIILGPGQWYLGTSRISLTAGPGIKILGSGSVMNDQASTNATVINAGAAANATGVFFFSHTASLISGTEIGNLDIVYSGTGNVFDDLDLQSGYFHDLNISLGTQGSACGFFTSPAQTANNSVIQVTLERVTITSNATTRTVPMVSITSQNSGGISDLSFLRCKFNNTGQDSAQPAVLVQCTASGAGYHYATTFRDCYFEKPLGGAIKSLSGSGLLIDHCMFWDMSGLTVGGSTVYVGAGSGNIGSQGVIITGCGRNRSGPNGSSTWDVECESTTSQVKVEGFHILASGQTTATNAFFNFHGCSDVLLENNVSPQGSAVNGNSTTVVTNPSPTQITLSQGKVIGKVTDSGGQVINVQGYGAKGDGKLITGASMTASSATLTSSGSVFASTDVGKLVMVAGAGTSGVPFAATISAFTSGTVVTLSASAATTVSGALCYYGTDDSAAFQAALTASQTTAQNDGIFLTSAAQSVYVPYGIYMIGTALAPQVTRSFRIAGDGAVCVTPRSAFLDFGGPGHLLEGRVEVSGLHLDAGGGHIFQHANIHGLLHFHHLNMVQRHPSYSLFYMDDVARADGNSTALYMATFSQITYWQGPGTRSIEMWHLVSNAGAELTDITWEHVNGPNPPGSEPSIDNTQYQYYLTCSSSTANQDIANIVWRDILAASFYGGLIKIGAATAVTIENVNIYNTYVEAETNDLFAFINDPVSGLGCKYVSIRDVHRNNNLGSAGTPACNDISFTSACSWITIDHYTTPYYGGQGPAIALNSAARVTILNCGGTAGTLNVTGTSSDTVMIQNGKITAGGGTMAGALAMGANKITGLGNGTAASDAAAFGQLPSGSTPLAIGSGGTGSATRNFAGLLTETAVKTSAYTAAAGDFVCVDTTSGAVTVTLPNAPPDLTVVGVKLIASASPANAVTIARNSGGTDVFNKAGGSTSLPLALVEQSAVLQYQASSKIWLKQSGDTPLSQLDTRYLLANGVTVSGTPAVGQVLTATSGTAAGWAAGGAGATGPAGPTGLNWRGTYSGATTYAANDAVYYNGSAFIATAGTTGVNPGTPSSPGTNWNALASIGNTGPAGSGVAGVTFPSNQGFQGWTMDPVNAAGNGNPVSGQIWGTKCTLPACTVSGVAYFVNTAGATLTTGQNLIGLYDSSGALQAQTADCSGATYTVTTTATSATVTGTGFIAAMVGAQYTIAGVAGTFTVSAVGSSTSLTMSATVPTTVTSAAMTPTANFSWLSTGIKYTPFVTAYTAANASYYPAFLSAGTTTPKFQQGTSSLNAGMLNALVAANSGTFRCGQLGALTSQTSLPSTITLSATSTTNSVFFMALYT